MLYQLTLLAGLLVVGLGEDCSSATAECCKRVCAKRDRYLQSIPDSCFDDLDSSGKYDRSRCEWDEADDTDERSWRNECPCSVNFHGVWDYGPEEGDEADDSVLDKGKYEGMCRDTCQLDCEEICNGFATTSECFGSEVCSCGWYTRGYDDSCGYCRLRMRDDDDVERNHGAEDNERASECGRDRHYTGYECGWNDDDGYLWCEEENVRDYLKNNCLYEDDDGSWEECADAQCQDDRDACESDTDCSETQETMYNNIQTWLDTCYRDGDVITSGESDYSWCAEQCYNYDERTCMRPRYICEIDWNDFEPDCADYDACCGDYYNVDNTTDCSNFPGCEYCEDYMATMIDRKSEHVCAYHEEDTEGCCEYDEVLSCNEAGVYFYQLGTVCNDGTHDCSLLKQAQMCEFEECTEDQCGATCGSKIVDCIYDAECGGEFLWLMSIFEGEDDEYCLWQWDDEEDDGSGGDARRRLEDSYYEEEPRDGEDGEEGGGGGIFWIVYLTIYKDAYCESKDGGCSDAFEELWSCITTNCWGDSCLDECTDEFTDCVSQTEGVNGGMNCTETGNAVEDWIEEHFITRSEERHDSCEAHVTARRRLLEDNYYEEHEREVTESSEDGDGSFLFFLEANYLCTIGADDFDASLCSDEYLGFVNCIEDSCYTEGDCFGRNCYSKFRDCFQDEDCAQIWQSYINFGTGCPEDCEEETDWEYYDDCWGSLDDTNSDYWIMGFWSAMCLRETGAESEACWSGDGYDDGRPSLNNYLVDAMACPEEHCEWNDWCAVDGVDCNRAIYECIFDEECIGTVFNIISNGTTWGEDFLVEMCNGAFDESGDVLTWIQNRPVCMDDSSNCENEYLVAAWDCFFGGCWDELESSITCCAPVACEAETTACEAIDTCDNEMAAHRRWMEHWRRHNNYFDNYCSEDGTTCDLTAYVDDIRDTTEDFCKHLGKGCFDDNADGSFTKKCSDEFWTWFECAYGDEENCMIGIYGEGNNDDGDDGRTDGANATVLSTLTLVIVSVFYVLFN